MTRLTFFDTETCGYHGPVILIQYAVDDSDIFLHEVWCEPIRDTLHLIESFCETAVVGFNLVYDWFHLQKLYNCLVSLANLVGFDKEPRDYIEEYASVESAARDGDCIKPASALDLMLWARKGPYQSTMDRKDIRIKRVPVQLAVPLARELERRVQLDELYFTKKKKDKDVHWKIFPAKNWKTGKDDPDFRDIVLKFAASSSLKVLAKHCLKLEEDHEILLFGEVLCEPTPIEFAWAPFATAVSSKENHWFFERGTKRGYAWPAVIETHIEHWRFNSRARTYANDDVVYTRGLYHAFNQPEHGDDDSVLACLVGSNRWRGFSINLEYLQNLRDKELQKTTAPRDPGRVYIYLSQVMTPTEQATFDEKGSTKKIILEELSTWKKDNETEHPVAIRAKEVLDSRKAFTKVVLFNKLLTAGRLHPSASVIGSLSSRMSGRTEVGDGKRSAGLNALGIQHDKEIREAFTLAFDDMVLNGGDFVSYEIGIADARYGDKKLREQLLTCFHCKYVRTLAELDEIYCPQCHYASAGCKTCKKTLLIHRSGSVVCSCSKPIPKDKPEDTLRKLHGLFSMALNPGLTYDEILATKGSSEDLYDEGKRGVFSQLYGGNEDTLVNRLGIDLEDAKAANAKFATDYQGVGRSRKEIYDKFCSMRQPDGIGKKVIWAEPEDAAYSLNGFPRYFTLENQICKALYRLAENPPKAWEKFNRTIIRRDRVQKESGAVRSAIFAAAFAIQAANMRAAANHEIQATGAIETKRLQVKLWRHQPVGVHPWKIQLLNIHDELMTPSKKELAPVLAQDVREFVLETRSLIPLLRIDWGTNLQTWADK